MMVSSADKLCDILSYDRTHTKLKVRVKAGSEEMPKEAIHLSKLDSSLAGGADYHVDLGGRQLFRRQHLALPRYTLCAGTISR